MNNEIGNTMTLAIHFGRTWEKAAGTFAIYPLPRLMTSLLHCFSDMHSSSPHADIENPGGGTSSAVLLHCFAGNAYPVSLFFASYLFSFVPLFSLGFWPGFMIAHPLALRRVMLTWTSRPWRQVCHNVDYSVWSAPNFVFLFRTLWGCINLHIISLSRTWLCVCTHLHDCIIHPKAYDLVCVLNRSDAFSSHVLECFAHIRFRLVGSWPWLLLFINHDLWLELLTAHLEIRDLKFGHELL